MSVVSIVLHSTITTKIVLMILTVFSVFSWTVMFSEYFFLKRMHQKIDQAREQLSSCHSFDDIHARFVGNRSVYFLRDMVLKGLQVYQEVSMCRQKASSSEIMTVIANYLDQMLEKRMTVIGVYIPHLAVVASISPYIGLLGTVWGIVSAFQNFADLSHVTLSQVAPDISEALISTAVSLLVAIPAVVAHSRLNSFLDGVYVALNDFQRYFLLQLRISLISGDFQCIKERQNEML